MLSHFTTSPRGNGDCATRARQVRWGGCPSRIRTSPNGFKVRCPTTRRRGNGRQGTRAKKWSGRRDSNPRPSPWQGDALPTEPLPLGGCARRDVGAESQSRTGDTAIFSRVLYQLSYLGPARPSGRTGPTAWRRIARALRRSQSRPVTSTGRPRNAARRSIASLRTSSSASSSPTASSTSSAVAPPTSCLR